MDNWSFRDVVLQAINQWYLILGFIILGGLIGLGITYVAPAPYRATADLYVGIDVTRINDMVYLIPTAEKEPLNLDDYKNWQLKQVADILVSTPILEDTLAALVEQDVAWQDVSRKEFRGSIDIYWYDTGIWQLEAKFPDKIRAEEAVQTWLNIGYEKLSELILVGEQVADLDIQIQLKNYIISNLNKEEAILESFVSSTEEWIELLKGLPSADTLPEDISKEFAAWVLVYSDDVDPWQVPLDNYPLTESTSIEYLFWLENTYLYAKEDLAKTKSELISIEKDRDELLPSYHAALDESYGLSSNLVLQPNTSTPSVSLVRSTGLVIIGGSILGFLMWMVFMVFRIKGTHVSDD